MIARLPIYRDTSQLGARLALMYRGTQFGLRMWLLFGLDCDRDLIALSIATYQGNPMANMQGRPCSTSYYDRKALTAYQRDRREIVAREERGERFERLFRRQA
jgi:hypothetical protein